MKRRELFFFFFFFEEEGTRELDRPDCVLQFVVSIERTDGEDGGVSVIPHICQFWYTTALFRPVKSTPKSV